MKDRKKWFQFELALWISSSKQVTTAEETRGFFCDSQEGL